MFNRKVLTATALAGVLAIGDIGAAHAQGAEAFVGGLLGGFIGAQAGQRARAPQRTRGVYVDPAASAARAANREIQTALNFFGWMVGAPDGSIGPRSRSGISMYQAYLGFAPTGQITEFERVVLVTAYQRAQFGGPQVTQVASRHPDGVRGLLEEVRDEMSGGGSRVAMSTPDPMPQPQPEPATAAAPAAPSGPAVPTFLPGGAAPQVSLASHCNRVALVTSANGGYTDVNTLRDPQFALNEQFCLARGYALAEGEALVAQIPGATPAQINAECAAFAPVLQPHVTALSLQPQAEVTRGLAQFVLTSGMAPTDLATTARICLSSGYATENMPLAIGSALLLHALGETGYGELPAHHLLQGIGAPQRRELAYDWFVVSVPQSPAAQQVGFAPGASGRSTLIHAALAQMTDRAAAPALAVPAAGTSTGTAAAPVFNLRGGN